MDLFLFCIAAFGAAILTFFSGFGLGTILTPLFLLSFPPTIAIALTGVVHFFNNVFKVFLVGRKADKVIVVKFGFPAIIMALIGSILLRYLPVETNLYSYTLFGNVYAVSPSIFIIAILLLVFALMDLIPAIKRLEFGKDKIALGGALSGFFGGLTGNQGALRSAFLIKAGLSKEAFIGTTVVISIFVDITRLAVYADSIRFAELETYQTGVAAIVFSAILGSFIGNKLLKKITLNSVRTIVALFLILLSIALALGLLGSH